MSHVLSFENWRTIQESEGYLYSAEERLNEGLSDFLHSVGDWASIVSDLVVPGSGAVVDFINALSYFIESMTLEEETESSAAAISGLISLGSMALPAVLQTAATKMKGFLSKVVAGLQKTASKIDIDGARTAAATVADFLLGIIKNITSISSSIVTKAKEFSKTQVGKFIQDKIGGLDKITNWVNGFFTKVKGWFQTMVDKINQVFPKSGAKTEGLTVQNVATNNYDNQLKSSASEKALNIANSVLKYSAPYTGQKKFGPAESSAVATGAAKVAGLYDLKAKAVEAGYGQKPAGWRGLLVNAYKGWGAENTTYSNAEGVKMSSGGSSDRIYLNKRYFQFPKGKAGQVSPTSRGDWKFVKTSISKDFPTGIYVDVKPDK